VRERIELDSPTRLSDDQRRAVLVGNGVSSAVPLSRSTAPAVPIHGDVGTGFEPFLKKVLGEIEMGQLRGVQAYVSRRGQALLNAGLGWAYESIPMRIDTITQWLCCTKPLVAIAIAQLEQQRVLDVDRPVAFYWPEFGANGKSEITLRMLLNHTSGMQGDPAEEYLFCSAEQIAAAIARGPGDVTAEPANRVRYIQFSAWATLGELIRRATGVSVGVRVQQCVFDPLGMRDSHLGLPLSTWNSYGERISRLHIAGRGMPEECSFLNWPEAAAYDWPGFAARGPAYELGRVYESLLGFGPKVLDSASVQRFTAPSRGRLYDHHLQEAIEWGLGFVNCTSFFGCRAPVSHVFGHHGLGSSFCVALPELDLVIVWVSNVVAEPAVHRGRMRRVIGTLLDCAGVRDP